MKKSTLFKILTLFLTFVITLSSSGCIYSLLMHNKEKQLQEALEIQKEKKALADALVPEIEGYIFEALPRTTRSEWKSKGFKTFDDFFRGGGRFYSVEKTNLENEVEYWIYPYLEPNVDQIEPLGYVMRSEAQNKYFEVFPNFYKEAITYINGEYFILQFMLNVNPSPHWVGAGAIALFLLDFEIFCLHFSRLIS